MRLYEHPNYTKYKSDWRCYQDLYAGGHDKLIESTYLWPHAMEKLNTDESKSLITSRRQRTRYFNLMEIVVSIWCSYFFRQAPQYDDAALKLLEDTGGLKDIDGQGTSFFTFIKDQVLVSYLLFGKVYILVDAPKATAQSRAQEEALKLRPYMSLLSPLDVKDWEIETTNPARIREINFLRHEFIKTLARSNATQEPKQELCCDALQIENGIYTIHKYAVPLGQNGIIEATYKDATNSIDWKEVEAPIQVPGFDEIPIAYIDATSWVKDLSEEVLRFHNLRSNYDNILYFQGYDTKFLIGINPKDAAQYRAMTEYSAVFLPEGASAVKLDANDPGGLEKACNESLQTSLKIGLNLLRQLPSDSRENQAAEAQREDKDNQYALIENSIDELEVVLQQALNYYAKFMGIDDFEGTVTLNRNIKDESLEDFITIYSTFRSELQALPTAKKAILKKAVSELLHETEAGEITEEIDAMSTLPPEPRPGINAAREALMAEVNA